MCGNMSVHSDVIVNMNIKERHEDNTVFEYVVKQVYYTCSKISVFGKTPDVKTLK